MQYSPHPTNKEKTSLRIFRKDNYSSPIQPIESYEGLKAMGINRIFKTSLVLAIFCASALLSGCLEFGEDDAFAGPAEAMGLRPIYDNSEAAFQISVDPPASLRQPGKIYVLDNTLYINEKNFGIHVLDNTNPRNPVYKAFINIPGNINMAIKDGVFYVNNYRDLVALRITKETATELERFKDVFPMQTEPDATDVYFECVDPSKGQVVGWEEALLKRPQCYK